MDLGWQFFLLSWITHLADRLIWSAPNGFTHMCHALAEIKGRLSSAGMANGAPTYAPAQWSPGIQTSYLQAQGFQHTRQHFHGLSWPNISGYIVPPPLCYFVQSTHRPPRFNGKEHSRGSKNLWPCFKTSVGHKFF